MSRILSTLSALAIFLSLILGGLVPPPYAYAAASCRVVPTTIANPSQSFNFTASGLASNTAYQILLNGVALPFNRSNASGDITTTITPAQFLGPAVSKVVVQLKQFPGAFVCNAGGSDPTLIVTVTNATPSPETKYYRCNPEKKVCEETTKGAVGASTDKGGCDLSCAQTGTTFTPTAPQIPKSAGQCDFNILDVFNPVKILICVIKNVISGVVNLFVTLALGLINYAIKINSTIYSAKSLAKFGFDTSLQITNLLFVVGIIVMAFGTMFRRSFGLQLLPRFVIIAFLIYFGFWASTLVVKISDTITQAFLNAANFNANSFAPIENNLNNGLGPYLGAGLEGIVGLFASIAFGMILVFALIAVAVIYIIRYIYLTLLIVLLPFALFLSIFPGLNIGGASGAWNRWIENFTRWIIFGPVMAFFIYLSLALLNSGYRPSSETGEIAFGALGDMLVLIGLLVFGLLTANSLGVAGSAYMMTLGGRGAGWARTAARMQALRMGTIPLRTQRGRQFTARLQRVGLGPLGAPLRLAGQQLSAFGAAGERLVSEDRFKGLSAERVAQMVPTLSAPERVAALIKLTKGRDLDKVTNLASIIRNPETKRLFDAYGKGSDYKKLERAAGFNTAMLNVTTPVGMMEEAAKFMADFSATDFKNMQLNDIYGEEPKFGMDKLEHMRRKTAISYGLIKNNPGSIRRIIAGLNYKNVDPALTSFTAASGYITSIPKSRGADPAEIKKATDIQNEAANVIKEAREKFRKGEMAEPMEPGQPQQPPATT